MSGRSQPSLLCELRPVRSLQRKNVVDRQIGRHTGSMTSRASHGYWIFSFALNGFEIDFFYADSAGRRELVLVCGLED